MTNEYLMLLDKNGYSESIVPKRFSSGCCLCGKGGDLARHEVFPGPYRQKSKRFGLWVQLCPACHTRVHGNRADAEALKQSAQRAAMYWYGWNTEEFIKEFGKNYER